MEELDILSAHRPTVRLPTHQFVNNKHEGLERRRSTTLHGGPLHIKADKLLSLKSGSGLMSFLSQKAINLQRGV